MIIEEHYRVVLLLPHILSLAEFEQSREIVKQTEASFHRTALMLIIQS